MKRRRLILGFIMAVMATLLTAVPVFAISDPATLEISSVYVYRHLQETDDQLYLIEYNIYYGATWPGDYPTETATEAFLVRLMDGSTELASTAPYAYYHNGYDNGVAAIYFAASEAPAWQGSYTAQIIGNPVLSWVADPPASNYGTFDNWSTSTTQSATSIELGNRILYYANELELLWGVDLIESAGGAFKLSEAYGENYFPNVVEDLRVICPDIFSIGVQQPAYTDPEYGEGDYSTTLDSGRAGTIFDWSGLTDSWGDSAPWFVRGLYLVGCIVGIYMASKKIGSYKLATLLAAPMIFIGVRVGILPMVFGALLAFFAAVLIAYVLFFQKSSI